MEGRGMSTNCLSICGWVELVCSAIKFAQGDYLLGTVFLIITAVIFLMDFVDKKRELQHEKEMLEMYSAYYEFLKQKKRNTPGARDGFGRIEHLALHHRKARVRKKNQKRIKQKYLEDTHER
jgi:hypothetical protein